MNDDAYNIHTQYLQDPQNFPPWYKCKGWLGVKHQVTYSSPEFPQK